ncbi:MAG: NADH:flavin oxidoreductase [Blautia sp.]
MSYYKAMFSPIQIGSVTIPNRFAVPPMGNNFANTDGTLSQRSLSYYGARAKGGFGLITIESTVVYKEAKGGPRKPCLFSDDTVDSFAAVAEECHRYGAKVSIQLQHAGPEGNSALTGYPLKAASAIPASDGREVPQAISTQELYQLIECYGDAAARAQKAGIDMVEVHCAHGYLVSTFISARTNKRTDEFGGCFENRMRLPRLIIENIRRKTNGTLPILCRINACDEVDGGQSVQDAAAVAAYLEEVCGVDAIHVSRAVHLHDEFMWAPGIVHGGFNADLVTEIKRAVSVPVIIVGRFTEPQYAELLVRQGRADIVAFGRQSIADPELPNKTREGRLEELTPCIGCFLLRGPCSPAIYPLYVKPSSGQRRPVDQGRLKKVGGRRWSRRFVRCLSAGLPGTP